ncbi:MAG: AAA family ATPase [Cyanobacteria bacterium P01_D01_bin.50]
MTKSKDWKIFQGNRKPHHEIIHLPPAPKWRKFNHQHEDNQNESTINRTKIKQKWQQFQNTIKKNKKDEERGETFRIQADLTNNGDNELYNNVIDAVNAALYLRRPLLVTGKPGSGKTSLAYAVAYELMLGSVLVWPITTRSTLQDGLYRYDAIARLQDVQLADKNQVPQPRNPETNQETSNNHNIGDYIQLGAVGTAFLPSDFPRVLLIDEIDKCDLNLPNDLLNLFEEGEFEIPELVRLSKHFGDRSINIGTKDGNEVGIKSGRVRCNAFPFVIMTSNGEREFPPAFLRRCLRVNMPQPQEDVLKEIVKSQLDLPKISEDSRELELIKGFVSSLDEGDNLAIDQLLNIVYMVTNENVKRSEIDIEKMKNLLLKALNSAEDR